MKKTAVKITTREEAEDEINAFIGRKVREIRDLRNLSAETVATELGMDRTNLSHIENGRNKITAVMLWKLATLFNCPVDRFFPKTAEKHSLSHSDIDLLKKEDVRVEDWASRCFKTVK